MFQKWLLAAVLLAGGVLVPGCGSGEKKPPVQQKTALDQAKELLKAYEGGQAPGSEGMTYPKLVEDVRKTDPAKADILAKGFADIQKTPGDAKSIAKELLGKL